MKLRILKPVVGASVPLSGHFRIFFREQYSFEYGTAKIIFPGLISNFAFVFSGSTRIKRKEGDPAVPDALFLKPKTNA
jgi:hypothetical protein